jgi:methionine-gamma-lyase
VDNTFATSYFQRPLELGADLSLSSCTKYIGGHADLLGGIVAGNKNFMNRMSAIVGYTGGIMGPHEAWLCIRGLKTCIFGCKYVPKMQLKLQNFLNLAPK